MPGTGQNYNFHSFIKLIENDFCGCCKNVVRVKTI